tara:strand:+ start:550 stop:714 length:165 start_codon:yes stop_codon:yes gene_type:complete
MKRGGITRTSNTYELLLHIAEEYLLEEDVLDYQRQAEKDLGVKVSVGPHRQRQQ